MMLDAAHGKSMKVMRIAMRSGRAQIRGRSPPPQSAQWSPRRVFAALASHSQIISFKPTCGTLSQLPRVGVKCCIMSLTNR